MGITGKSKPLLQEPHTMRIQTLVAGACAAALIPTLALAQQTCEQRQSTRVVGTLAGAGIGALAGSAIAGHGARNEGAVVGGVAGAAVEEGSTKQKGVEITVKLDGGRMIAVTQAAEPNEVFRVGERVRILSGGGVTRVSH